MKDKIVEFARNIGFDDIRFAPAVALERPPSTGPEADRLVYDPREIMPEALSVIVLFLRYSPAAKSGGGWMNVSEYNRASNRAYHMARETVDFLLENGAKARLETRLYAKGTALLTGGFAGRNGLYYHETFGSLVAIQTVLTDIALKEEYGSAEAPCGSCGACVKACPTGAVSAERGLDAAKCLRRYMGGVVPEEMREGLYQLFGCEICQAVCPVNAAAPARGICYRTSELIGGEHVQELKEEAGGNVARSGRIVAQALLYAGTCGDRALLPAIEKLLDSESEPVREHAAWALKRLKGEL
jgi:epoxyqueuosine reductase QueG